jgi:hypothetical protein
LFSLTRFFNKIYKHDSGQLIFLAKIHADLH